MGLLKCSASVLWVEAPGTRGLCFALICTVRTTVKTMELLPSDVIIGVPARTFSERKVKKGSKGVEML